MDVEKKRIRSDVFWLQKCEKVTMACIQNKMVDGVAKMELDLEEGCCYATGIRVEKEDNEKGEQPARKKGRHNNPLTSAQQECKCGALRPPEGVAEALPLWKA
jgi:hypothetical protein